MLVDDFYKDIQGVLSIGDSYRDRVIIRLLVLGALRTGRLLRLRVSDIDFDNCRFKGYNGGNPVYIPLDSISMLAIKRYLEEERPKGVRTDILLLSRLGNPLLKWGIVQILNKYQDKIDFNLDCRTLRLSGLAIWYLSGMKIEDILRRGGYKDSPRQRYRVQRDINDIIG